MSWVIILLAGLSFFLGVYLSFDYWYERIWTQKLLQKRIEYLKFAEDVFVKKTEAEANKEMLISGSLAAVIILFLFSSILPLAILLASFAFYFAWGIPLLYYKHFIQPRRVTAFTNQLIDGLTLMANAMKSGLNIPQALQVVVDEMPSPIRDEFGLILAENKVGLSLEKAFENLAKRIRTEDINMFVMSTNILRETGGNVSETFETIVKTIRERLKLQSKISAMVSQGMTSAVIVGAMPLFMVGMLYTVDPAFMGPMFRDPVGWAIFAVVILLELIGFFVIMKIVKIRV